MPGKVRLVILLGIVLATVFSFGLSAGAAPGGGEDEDEVGAAQQRLAQMRMEAGSAYAAHDNAVLQLKGLDEEIASVSRDLDGAEEDLAGAQAQLQERAAQMYKSGNVGFVDVLVGAEDFSDFANRLELWIKLLGRERAEFEKVREARDEIAQKKAELEASRDRRAAALGEADGQIDRAAGLEEQSQAYLDSLNDQTREKIKAQQDQGAELAKKQGEKIRADIAKAEPEAVRPAEAAKKEVAEAPAAVAEAPEEAPAEPKPQAPAEDKKETAQAPEKEIAQTPVRNLAAEKKVAQDRAAEKAAAERYAAEKAQAAKQARQAAERADAAQQARLQAAAKKAQRRAALAQERAAAQAAAEEQARQAAQEAAQQQQPAGQQQYGNGSGGATGGGQYAGADQYAAGGTAAGAGEQAPAGGGTGAAGEGTTGGSGTGSAGTTGGVSGSGTGGASTGAGGATATGAAVVAEASKYMGTPYVLGGPAVCVPYKTMDCTCLTTTVYAAFGISLPNLGPASQFGYGTPVSGPPMAGDLLFWNEDGSGITHVGIATGNGTTIHASAFAGYVTETPIEYINGYVGARRLL